MCVSFKRFFSAAFPPGLQPTFSFPPSFELVPHVDVLVFLGFRRSLLSTTPVPFNERNDENHVAPLLFPPRRLAPRLDLSALTESPHFKPQARSFSFQLAPYRLNWLDLKNPLITHIKPPTSRVRLPLFFPVVLDRRTFNNQTYP